MSDSEYPLPVRQVVKTLTELCRYQNREDLVEILENAHAQIVLVDYDNYHGGTSTYRLNIGIGTGVYAAQGAKIEIFEKEILSLVAGIDKAYENDHLNEVVITPLSEESAIYGQRRAPSENETRHIWIDGYFRLFLSHLAEHKVEVHKLKEQLQKYGISAFVAHDDIQPSKEWQVEIELALRSMDCLAALVTPKFIESRWCDQEVGWAFGRGIPVLPVRLECDPHGFASKFQAISGTLESPQRLAQLIFETLCIQSETSRAICRAMPSALIQAPSFAISQRLAPVVAGFEDYTDSEKEVIWKACQENSQVHGSWGVTKMIYDRIGKPPKIAKNDEEIPF